MKTKSKTTAYIVHSIAAAVLAVTAQISMRAFNFAMKAIGGAVRAFDFSV